MEEFTTYLFRENELKTWNKKVVKERTYLIGLLIALTGYSLYLLDIKWGTHILMTGVVVLLIGRLVMSGKEPSIGHRPTELKIRSNSIVIGNDEIPIQEKENLLIHVVGYRGQGMIQRVAFYKTHNGNENTLSLIHNDREVKLNFVLESEHHLDKLITFCAAHGFKLRK